VSDNIRLSAVRHGADLLVPVMTQESRSGDVDLLYHLTGAPKARGVPLNAAQRDFEARA
jgi:hypothetical protein